VLTSVARTSQLIDRRKVGAYARIGVAVYWLLDLAARRLELRSDPDGDDYRSTRLLGENETVSLPGTHVSWTVASMLT
jgi:Uma2 family endonuclease